METPTLYTILAKTSTAEELIARLRVAIYADKHRDEQLRAAEEVLNLITDVKVVLEQETLSRLTKNKEEK